MVATAKNVRKYFPNTFVFHGTHAQNLEKIAILMHVGLYRGYFVFEYEQEVRIGGFLTSCAN